MTTAPVQLETEQVKAKETSEKENRTRTSKHSLSQKKLLDCACECHVSGSSNTCLQHEHDKHVQRRRAQSRGWCQESQTSRDNQWPTNNRHQMYKTGCVFTILTPSLIHLLPRAPNEIKQFYSLHLFDSFSSWLLCWVRFSIQNMLMYCISVDRWSSVKTSSTFISFCFVSNADICPDLFFITTKVSLPLFSPCEPLTFAFYCN